ncbi:MAG: caspase family protein [Candidatus Edwardsbacteria bacterium]
MKKYLFMILAVSGFVTFQNITYGSEVVKPKYWAPKYYLDIFGARGGYPLFYNLHLGRGGIGWGPGMVETEIYGIQSIPDNSKQVVYPYNDYYKITLSKKINNSTSYYFPLIFSICLPAPSLGYTKKLDSYFNIYFRYCNWGHLTKSEDLKYYPEYMGPPAKFIDFGIGLHSEFLSLSVGMMNTKILGTSFTIKDVNDYRYKVEYKGSEFKGPYVSLELNLGGFFGPREVINPPKLAASVTFSDADGNGILSGNEEGKLSISILNSGEGVAKNTGVRVCILENEFKERIICKDFVLLGNIEGYGRQKVDIPIKAKGELPKGKFTMKIDCSYQTQWGEEGKVTKEVSINTAPASGMIKVAFKNFSSEGLPSWIVPTAPEYADYQVECSLNKVTILNLNTGERKSQKIRASSDAQKFVKDFFLSWDKSSPTITFSSTGGTVNTQSVKILIRLCDDRKLDKMEVYLNDQLHKTESFAELTETEREIEFPLKMGDNTLKIVLTDWVGKSAEDSITFTRLREGSGTYVAGKLPKGAPPPDLRIEVSPLDGNNTIVGGKEEGIKVIITNKGKGTAKWVRVILEGDDFLASTWGKERNLEDIKPGETKTATFSLLMPTELPRRETKIQVLVKEGRGYSPTVKPSLTFSLVPAEVGVTPVEMVEDVDYDIPQGRIRRENGYALIIGLSKYSNAPAPKYSKNDAEVFAKYASKILGIANSKTLYDDKATLGTIKANLTDWLNEKRGFKVIYFAGHGVPDPKNPREGDVYLLPYDGDPELRSTLVSLKEISELGAVSEDTVLVILDACFSGSEGRTVQLAQRPVVVAKISETNATTLAAAEGSQPSKEFEKAQHGYFTYYTLLGLKGKADANGDGWITTTELYQFVKDKVSDATNNVQIPVLRPEKEIRIGRVR